MTTIQATMPTNLDEHLDQINRLADCYIQQGRIVQPIENEPHLDHLR